MANRRDERMKEITDRLQAGLEELFSSEKYTEYLRVMSQFHHYSFNNTLLIALQRPDATLVAGYRAWETKFNRHVIKGEKGIQIIAPAPIREKQEQEKTDPNTGEVVLRDDGQPETEEVTVTIPRFRVSTVFDLSQTAGDPLPELGVEELTASVENYDIFMEAIRSVAPVPIRFDEIQSGAKGYYDNANKEIVLQVGMAELQTMKTAVHETTHALLHDRDIMQEQGIQKDQMTRECEAESCAFTVLSHFGLDTSDYSFPYIGGWSSSREMKEVKASMDTIRRTASEIIDGIESSMREQLLERNADRYEIYQLGEESALRDLKFMNLDYFREKGSIARKEDYDLVYTAPLKAEDTLDSLYEKFNLDHPADFTGHSLSVSDVVLLHRNGEDHAWFVDSFGFTEIPEFLELAQETVIETPEMEALEKEAAPEKPEIYRHSVVYAREHGELEEYRASMRENVACKEGIEQAIRENFDGMHLNPVAVRSVLEQYGTERTAYVLANTIQQKSWDGRFSGSNKEWAQSVAVGEDTNTAGEDRRRAFVVDSHPAVLDGFTDLFRKELRDRGLLQDGKEPSEKGFIDHYYVVEDLAVRGPLAIKEYQNLDEALSAYFAIPNDRLKALGIQNTSPMPGSLDFIQCQNGIDTMTMDHTAVEVWNNPEIQAVHAELELALALHDTEIAYELGDRYFMIQTTAGGFDYSFYDQNYRLIDGGILENTAPGETVKTMEEAVHEILEDNGLSYDDAAVVSLEEMMEKVQAAEEIALDEDRIMPIPELSETQKLAAELDQFAYDHDYYGYMDAIDDRDESVRNLAADLEKGDVAGIRDWLKEVVSECDVPEDVATAKELLGKLDALYPEKQPSLTFYAAECMEYPVLGEYREASTLEDAMRLYEQIPSDRMNGGKGIGFNLDDGSDYAGSYPLVQGGKVATDMIDLVEHYKNSPLVQQAVEEAKRYYPDMRETEYQPREAQETAPVVEQKNVEEATITDDKRAPEPAERRSETVEKGTEGKSASRKESVLKALRERQAQIKEREKTLPQKQYDRNKEEHAL